MSEHEDDDMETNIQTFEKHVDEMFLEENERLTTSFGVFHELLCKIQQVQENEDDLRNCIRQGMSLCNELIDTIKKATIDDFYGFQSCLQLLYQLLSSVEFRVFVEDDKLFAREMFFASLDLL